MNVLAQTYSRVFFLGIGGIGMSALARYFKAAGLEVAGYDKTQTPLTAALEQEGMQIHYEDRLDAIPPDFRNVELRDKTLVIRTPAVPADHIEQGWFKENQYTLLKRSEVLGIITRGEETLAVAGTHGKTTTSSILAHILHQAGHNCTAFLGGISVNLGSNLLLGQPSAADHQIVVEADEFDRSFLALHPHATVITSMDPDHLDIYGTAASMQETYRTYACQVSADGVVLLRYGLDVGSTPARQLRYGVDTPDADYSARRVRIESGLYCFDLHTPGYVLEDLKLGLPGRHNVENAVGACALALESGLDPAVIPAALMSYAGVYRRFERHVLSERHVYIDDYAHHPEEIRAAILSAKELFPDRKLTVVFQPHLYSRTRDFLDGFASVLALSDSLFLLDIYPARELPIPGITSGVLLDRIQLNQKQLVGRDALLERLQEESPALLLTLGAGDIDQLVQPITKLLQA